MTGQDQQLWVGIDIGKRAHHAAAIDVAGNLVWSHRITNDQESIERIVALAMSTSTDVRWAVDMTSHEAALLLGVLNAAGQSVQYVPGRIVHRMTGAFTGEGKTDARDSLVIAQTARMRSDISQIAPPDEMIVELTVLTGHRTDRVGDWTRGVNRLRGLLTSIFPGLERSFDYSTRAGLILLTGYCTPASIRAATDDELAGLLRAGEVRRPTIPGMVTTARDMAEGQRVVLPGEAAVAHLVMRLAGQLLELDREVKDLDKQIAAVFRRHRHAHIIESVPGIGTRLGAEFLAATGGGDMAAFGSAAKLAAYTGPAPVSHDSGRRSGVLHRPQRYHRDLRRVFYMAAFSGAQRSGPSREFYQRKRGEHRHHNQAVIALARRLVDVLWALLRDERSWTADPPGTSRLMA
ncbi:IS110 family transposase [Rhodococcus sp. APC 3903]|uniref:IS110 family transposase n=1 Tax=Rhodococcus sp. APC 3903 TaxID=3035193 RepID=UPI0025B41A97|nr:IS110 family transposase [Rhodococcus sp. APC 3903]MDN3461081.1 IS110 family transposase [Rhodococcus sp. APC 3903]